MKRIIISLLVTGFSINAIAQTVADSDTSCNFLKNIEFKNGVDTLVVKAILLDLTKAPPKVIDLKKSNKGGQINQYKFNSLIWFKPENCLKQYNAPLKDFKDHEHLLNKRVNLGIIVYLTCIVFDGDVQDDGTPYFMVINVTTKNPKVPRE